MLTPEDFEAFMKDNALLLGVRAHAHYQQEGRGFVLVLFTNPEDPREFCLRYVPATEARERGFSGEILKAVDLYRPEREAVFFVQCGDSMKLLQAQFSFNEVQDGQ